MEEEEERRMNLTGISLNVNGIPVQGYARDVAEVREKRE